MKNRNHPKVLNRPGIALRGIWYLLLFLAVVSLSLFFASKILFGAALGMLLFAVLDLWAAKKEAQKFSGIQAESSKDSFILTLKNPPRSTKKIFSSEILFTARLRNLLTGEGHCENLSLTDGKQAELSLGDSCGKYVMEGSYFRSADLLGLGAFTIRIDGFRAAAVRLPKTAKTEYEGFGTGMLDLDGSVYDEYRAGFDQSEVFEIRPYRPGDKTAQIHWKLSQKTDTLMLRQGSLPVKNALLLILEAPQGKQGSQAGRPARAEAFPVRVQDEDFPARAQAENFPARVQRAAAGLFSLSESLAEKGVQHHIGYLASDAKNLTITEISGRESLTEHAGAILSSPLYLGISAAELYLQEKEQWEFSHVLIINDEEIQEM